MDKLTQNELVCGGAVVLLTGEFVVEYTVRILEAICLYFVV